MKIPAGWPARLLFLPAAAMLWLGVTAPRGALASAETGEAPPAEKKYKTASETYGFLRARILDLVPKDEKEEKEPYDYYYRDYRRRALPMAGLKTADFDGDGFVDFFISDPQNDQFVIFFGKRPAGEKKQEKETEGEKDEEKDLEPEYVTKEYDRVEFKTARMRAFDFSDINSDGKLDMIFTDDENDIVVRYQEQDRKFADDTRVELPARSGKVRSMRVADIDGDGAEEVIALNTKFIIVIKPTPKGTLKEHATYQNISGRTRFHLADFNGDGLPDLALFDADRPQEVTVRLQEKGGGFDVEYTQTIEGVCGHRFADIDGDGRDEMIAFLERLPGVRTFRFMTSGEVKQATRAIEDFHFGSMHAFPFDNAGSKSMAVGDIDGDGKNDIVVLDGAAAQLLVYRQADAGSLEEREEYASLSEGDEAAIADIDGDGRNEIIVLSEEEKTIGVCREEKTGKIGFPRPLATKHTPVAMAVGDVNGDGRSDLVYAARNSDDDGFLYVMVQRKDGGMADWREMDLSTNQILAMRGLRIADLDSDGKADIMALFRSRAPALLIQGEDGKFEDAAKKEGFKPGLLANYSAGSFSLGDVDGDGAPEMIVCRKNFARAMQFSKGALNVVDQYGGDTAGARILKALTADLNGDGRNEILMLDGASRKLGIRERTGKGMFKTVKDLDIGNFRFKDIFPVDMNGDGSLDIVIFGDDKFGVLYANALDPKFEEVADYHTEIKDCKYTGMEAGDVNGDGKPDLVLVDGGSHHVEILSFGKDGTPRQELTFKVFERGFEDFNPYRREAGLEPKELLLADVDGDKRLDIVIFVHKKAVFYPQQPRQQE